MNKYEKKAKFFVGFVLHRNLHITLLKDKKNKNKAQCVLFTDVCLFL